MPQGRKITTCTYCGSRTVLVFDRARHELTCSACGAPLHEMKALPLSPKHPQPVKPRKPAGTGIARPHQRPKRRDNDDDDDEDRRKYRYASKKRPKRRRKGFGRWLLEEAWDVVEDIFD